jgi:uncharacterized protein involved in oxidation of intracellular sulfur
MRTKILVIVNGPAYGADGTYNAVWLANALARRDDAEVVVLLMGDAVTCAIAGRRTPDGYYALDRMLRSFARHDGRIACCGTCLDVRGLTTEQLIAEAARSTLDELTDWTVEADRVLTF